MSGGESNWFLDHLPASISGVILGAIAWLAQRAIAKVDAQEARIAALERDKVTKADIEDLRESNNDTITRAFARVETRTDEILLHLARRDDR